MHTWPCTFWYPINVFGIKIVCTIKSVKAGTALFCSVRFDGRGAEPDCVATCHLCCPTMLPYLTLVSVHHQI